MEGAPQQRESAGREIGDKKPVFERVAAPRRWRRAAAGTLLGLILAWLPYITDSSAKTAPAYLVAARSLSRDRIIQPSDLVIRRGDAVHPRLLRPSDRSAVVGARLRSNVPAGYPLLWSDIEPAAELRHPLAALLTKDEQAITVPLAGRRAPPIAPGDRVDLWWQAGARMERAAGNLTVLAVNGEMSAAPVRDARDATFAIPVTYVHAILDLDRQGRFFVTVRSLRDESAPRWYPVRRQKTGTKRRLSRTPRQVITGR